jgi:hypothetical protein
MFSKLLCTSILSLLAATAMASEISANATLDFLLDVPKCWELSPEAFETHYNSIRPGLFRWLTSDHSRAKFSRRLYSNATISLTAFDPAIPVEEAVVDFADGHLNLVTLSIYNRGDAANITSEEFKNRHMMAGKAMGAKLNAKPLPRPANRQQGLLTEGFGWESPLGTAVLDCNEGATTGSEREFLRLRIARPNASGAIAESMKNSRGGSAARLSTLAGNLTRDDKGNVFIRNMPMVDQGDKGYCLPAATQRVFEYYGIGADMHQIAQVAESDSSKGTNAVSMAKELDRIDYRFKTRLFILGMEGSEGKLTQVEIKKGEYYVGKPIDERKFIKDLHGYIDGGIPLLWALELGKFPEEPDLKPQMAGGHMRLIIGYNEKTGRIIFTDTWGAGHEFKTMKESDAYAATQGLFVLKPTLH